MEGIGRDNTGNEPIRNFPQSGTAKDGRTATRAWTSGREGSREGKRGKAEKTIIGREGNESCMNREQS